MQFTAMREYETQSRCQMSTNDCFDNAWIDAIDDWLKPGDPHRRILTS
jgi:hypothetical protein